MNRQEQIINILLDSQQPLTQNQVAEFVGVSSRTIRNDIESIKQVLSSYYLELIIKPRVGMFVEGTLFNKNQLRMNLSQELKSQINPYSKECRRLFIASKLLLNPKGSYIEYFVNETFSSKATIEKDIQYISGWLSRRNLQLMRDNQKGYWVAGDEILIRNAYLQAISTLRDHNLVDETFIKKIDLEINSAISIIQNWNQQYQCQLSHDTMLNFAFHVELTVKRVLMNQIIQDHDSNQPNLDDLLESQIVIDLLHQIEREYRITLPKQERIYILLHLIGFTIETNKFLVDNRVIEQLRQLSIQITTEFTENLEKILSIGLSQNTTFKQSLTNHLLPALYRLKYGLNVYNPLVNQIRTEYMSSFALASIINASFEKYVHKKASDQEIAFIAVYISLEIEKSRSKPTIAIVCPLGKGISRFLQVKLQEIFRNANFVSCSESELNSKQYDYIDLVISTIALSSSKKYLQISPIVNESDIAAIKVMIDEFESPSQEIFSQQTTLVVEDKLTKHEILQKMVDALLINHHVEKQFYEDVLKREQLSSTEIGQKMVLTHGFIESVNKTQVVFCKMKQEIIWNNEPVNFIVMLAIDKHHSKNMIQLDWIYKMLIDESFVKRMDHIDTASELYQLVLEIKQKQGR